MKKIILFSLILLLLVNISFGFTLEGNLINALPNTIYVVRGYDSSNNIIGIDTTTSGYYMIDFDTTVYKIDAYQQSILRGSTSQLFGWDSSQIVNITLQLTVPVKLFVFTASAWDNNVTLSWETEFEINNKGFEIYRDNQKVGWKDGQNKPTWYKFTDQNVPKGKHWYKIRQIDFNGNYEDFTPTQNPVDVTIPRDYGVKIFPNPFNGDCLIDCQFPDKTKLDMKVYDITGRLLHTFWNNYIDPGYYRFAFLGSDLSTGIYLLKVNTKVYRLMLVK